MVGRIVEKDSKYQTNQTRHLNSPQSIHHPPTLPGPPSRGLVSKGRNTIGIFDEVINHLFFDHLFEF